MKRIIRHNRILVIAFLTLFAGSALAADPGTKTNGGVPAELQLQGLVNNQPLVTLQVNAEPRQDDFTIRITDSEGNNLYEENIRAHRFTKKFLFNTRELGDETLQVEIVSHSTGLSRVYLVHAASATLREAGQRR